MDLYDFGSEYAKTYSEQCKECGKTYEVSTQKDNHPEYFTEVYLKCECGASVLFDLPVN